MVNVLRIVLFVVMVFVLVFCLAYFVAGFDQQKTLVFNESDLPINSSFNFSVNLLGNETAYFVNVTDNYDFFDISLPSESFFDNVTSLIVQLNYSIIDFGLFHDYFVNESFLITNSVNNDVFSYGVFLNLSNNVFVSNVSDNWDFEFLNSSEGVNVSKSHLPFSGSFFYALRGEPNSFINMSCTGVLSCPSNITTNNAGLVNYTINYFLPINLSIGTFYESYVLSFNNSNGSLVHFNDSIRFIISPIIPVWENYVWDEDCFIFSGYNNQTGIKLSCIDDFYNHTLDQFGLIAGVCEEDREESYFKGYSDCEKEVEPELVITGSIDDFTYNELVDCRDDRDSYRSDFNDIAGKVSSVNNKWLECNASLLSKQEDYDFKINECLDTARSEYDSCVSEKMSLRWRMFGNVFLVLVLVIVAFFGLRTWWRRKHDDHNFKGFGGLM